MHALEGTIDEVIRGSVVMRRADYTLWLVIEPDGTRLVERALAEDDGFVQFCTWLGRS